jgi:hypothetical protein
MPKSGWDGAVRIDGVGKRLAPRYEVLRTPFVVPTLDGDSLEKFITAAYPPRRLPDDDIET